MPISESIASRILCLPLAAAMDLSAIATIVSLINSSLKS
jgi:dTDP-4-amino-4,6-dideoxygalactose transaminase